MRTTAFAARLLAATAIGAISSVPAWAGDYGIQSTDPTVISNPDGTTVQGDKSGVYSTGSELNLDNAGTIRGDGLSGSVFNSDGGIIVSGGPATIGNSGDISGARFGISTIYFINPDSSTEGRAIGSTIDNSGSIVGESDDGIRLIGGGTVTNSGYIAGLVGGGADGISMFAYNGQDISGLTNFGSVTNLAGGVIDANRFGIIIVGSGSIDNAGTINRTVRIQSSALFAPGQGTITNSGTINNGGIEISLIDSGTVTNSGLTGTIGFAGVSTANVNNSGTVTYFTSFNTVGTASIDNSGSIGEGLIFNKTTTANVTNSGSITATNTPDVVGTTQDAVYSDANLSLTNTATGSIDGFISGIHSDLGSATIANAGTIRGNGTSTQFGSPSGGIVVTGGPFSLTNSGSISGNRFGVTTFGTFIDPNSGALSGTAIGSTVANSGSIIGDNDDGVRLIGGGTVNNSGTIAGRVGGGADGVSMFAYNDQVTGPQIGTVNNLLGGTIEGHRWGIILSGGGTINNAGTINGGGSGALLIQQGFTGGSTGAVTNQGAINGNVRLLGLDSSTLANSGTITGGGTGSAVLTDGPMTLTNNATGSITGFASGVFSSGSSFTLDNAGTIRGNGNGTDFNAPQAGVLFTGGPGVVTNSGLISGARFGISTFGFQLASGTNQFESRAINSSVANTGTIIGDSDDGVRLIGGGTVTNSGYIAGRVGAGADGVSMFANSDQDTTNLPQIGTVNNLAGGTIEGQRFGIILSGGGTIDNAGTINSASDAGILIQTGFIGGKTANIVNTGAINGQISFNDLASIDIRNSGSITSISKSAIQSNGGNGPMAVTNDLTGSITGAASGIASADSAFTLDNAGSIRGNGTALTLRVGDAGVQITGGPAAITNSGSISGAGFGITTGTYSDPETNAASSRAVGSTVANSGSIVGDTNDGVRLIGGGTVTNSGTIAGRVGAGADGVSMFAFSDQPTTDQIGTVNNLAGGTIEGQRFGIILSGGGTIDNAGTINSASDAGILIQTGFVGGKTANIVNSGAINGQISFNELASIDIRNSGTITSLSQTAIQSNDGNGPMTLTNSATGSITGADSGVYSVGPSLTLDNAGTIRGNGTFGVYADGDLSLDNSGTIIASPASPSAFNGFGVWTNGLSDIVNSGTVTASGNGVTALGLGSTVDNSGSISSTSFAGVAIRSGSVTNSGQISAGNWGIEAQGETSVVNAAGGSIAGGSVGIYFTDGAGSVSNAGTIAATGSDAAIAFNSMGASSAASVTNSGSINGSVQFGSNQNATLNNSGSIASRGSGIAVWSITPTTLVNSGSISTTGATAISLLGTNTADSVTLLTGSSITGDVDGGSGTDSLSLSGTIATPTSSQTVGRFLNFETLNVLGGYWTAPGNTGSFGSTTVSGGTFAVNGSITSPITVSPGATLGGTGAITGNVTIGSGATFAPGNSVGTINVTGNVGFGAGSIFSVQTTPGGLSDRLTVNGSVTINSAATLQVLAGAGTYGPLSSFTILTATGSITGKFGTVTSDLAFLKPNVATKSGSIILTLTQNGKPIKSAATVNTLSTATAISSFNESNPIYQAVLGQSLNGARQAFDALSGSAYGRLDALMAADVGRIRLGLDESRSDAAQLDWSGVHSISAQGVDGSSSIRRGRLSMMMVGGQYASQLSSLGITGDVRTRFLASAAAWRAGRFQGLASVTTAWHDISVTRAIAFPGFSDAASSRYAAETHRVDLEGSYALARGRFALAPYAGISRIMMTAHSFQETGGLSALSLGRDSRSIDEARAGVRMAGEFRLGGMRIAPHADVSVERAWGDLSGARVARFAGGTEDFDSIASGFGSRSAEVEAGVDLSAGPMTLSGSYRGRFSNGWTDHAARISAALKF